MAISMLKIRRPLGRLIFNMGIAIPGKTVFLIETAPWMLPGKNYNVWEELKFTRPNVWLIEQVPHSNIRYKCLA